MYRLTRQDRARVLSMLVEGVSVSSTCRLTGFSKTTILRLLVEVGDVCQEFLDRTLRGLACRRIQADEIWSFVHSKAKNTTEAGEAMGFGDVWLWLAIDADTKLIVTWLVGSRDAECAVQFMKDVASRLTHRIQLSTDGHGPYLEAVDGAFGCDIDYAQLVKLYGTTELDKRYRYLGARKTAVTGEPDPSYVSTTFSERLNLTVRMSDRRYTRKTNAHSKKLRNHRASVALHVMFYNFVRVHMTLRVTPAMEAGIATHVWSMEDVVAMLEAKEREAPQPARKRGPRLYKPHGLPPIKPRTV